ncbi:MAG: hypothetical protein ACTS5F_01715 [Candidatus Hodgkinia cicadicola]
MESTKRAKELKVNITLITSLRQYMIIFRVLSSNKILWGVRITFLIQREYTEVLARWREVKRKIGGSLTCGNIMLKLFKL